MKRILYPTVLFAFLGCCTLYGCGNASDKGKGAQGGQRQIGQYVVNPDVDNPSVYLTLVESHETDSSVVYTGKSLHDQDTIGLEIEVIKSIPAGLLADGNPDNEGGFTPGAIKFRSLGAESDNFVHALGALYKIPAQRSMTDDTILPLVFSSNRKEVDLGNNGTYTFKLFLDSAAGSEAEVFAVLDLYKRLFELRAKDTTHYERIVSAFEGE